MPTPTPEVQTLEVTKAWDDAENQDGIRPERISVTLLADGEAIDTAILSEENRWTATVKECITLHSTSTAPA